MTKHYCRTCGLKLGYIQNVDPTTDFTGSVEDTKFKKYVKHTNPNPTGNGLISTFPDADYDKYKNYIIDTANSGSVEIDDRGRINLIWFANKVTGKSFLDGQYQQTTDGVKLVLHSDIQKIHPFPTGSHGFQQAICHECGNSLVV